MWIKVTSKNGQKVYINIDHVVEIIEFDNDQVNFLYDATEGSELAFRSISKEDNPDLDINLLLTFYMF